MMASPQLQDVALRFKTELEDTIQNLHVRSQNLNNNVVKQLQKTRAQLHDACAQMQSKLGAMKSGVQQMTVDMSALESAQRSYLVETNLWLAVCLFALNATQVIGVYMSPLIGLASSTSSVLLLTYIMLPTWAALHLRKCAESDAHQRRLVLGFSMLMGVLTGHLVADLHLSHWAPPAFLVPLSVAVTAGCGQLLNRQSFLGVAVGLATAVCLLWGFMVGMPAAYLMEVAMLVSLGALDTQVKIRHAKTGYGTAALDQLTSVMGYVICFFSLTYVFLGHRSEEVGEINV